MRMRRKKHQSERIEACGELLISDPFALSGRWPERFGQGGSGKELCLEIGCGKGGFITKMARENEDTCFIGIEKLESVLLLALEKAKGEQLKNLLFICSNAGALEQMFAQKELSRIYINFPDPWPHERHAKRRLTHERLAKSYPRVLKDGGALELKTDDLPLFLFSLQSLPECGFELMSHTFDLHEHGERGVMTEYEAKFHAQGKKIMKAVFKNIGGAR